MIKITNYGTTHEFGLGFCWDFEYKDFVFRFGKWYIAIGIKRGIK